MRLAGVMLAFGLLATPGLAAAADSAPSQAETAFWNWAKNSHNPQDFADYLDKYPNGAFAGQAKERIAALKAGAESGDETVGDGPPADSAANTEVEAQLPAPPADPNALAVTWVVRNMRTSMVDQRPGRVAAGAAFGIIGGLVSGVAAVDAGRDIIKQNAIENPANLTGREIARSYAAAHGYRLAEPGVVIDPTSKQTSAAAIAGSSRYVVDVAPPDMLLSYFSFDWAHYGMQYVDTVKIIDASTGAEVARAKCFLHLHHLPETATHAELLADHAAGLKAMIRERARACAASFETDLGLPARAPH